MYVTNQLDTVQCITSAQIYLDINKFCNSAISEFTMFIEALSLSIFDTTYHSMARVREKISSGTFRLQYSSSGANNKSNECHFETGNFQGRSGIFQILWDLQFEKRSCSDLIFVRLTSESPRDVEISNCIWWVMTDVTAYFSNELSLSKRSNVCLLSFSLNLKIIKLSFVYIRKFLNLAFVWIWKKVYKASVLFECDK